jgi:hypothetical protein
MSQVERKQSLKSSMAGFVVVLLASFAQQGIAGPLGVAQALGEAVVGGSLFVAEQGEVVATYERSRAGFTNLLYFVDGSSDDMFLFNNRRYGSEGRSAVGDTVSLGTFAAGTELIFRLLVTNRGNDFFTGSPGRNKDGLAHARATTSGGRTHVGFEDILGGGDMDFNDLQFSLSNVSTRIPGVGDPQVIPTPSPLALVFLGLALVSVSFGGPQARRAHAQV